MTKNSWPYLHKAICYENGPKADELRAVRCKGGKKSAMFSFLPAQVKLDCCDVCEWLPSLRNSPHGESWMLLLIKKEHTTLPWRPMVSITVGLSRIEWPCKATGTAPQLRRNEQTRSRTEQDASAGPGNSIHVCVSCSYARLVHLAPVK